MHMNKMSINLTVKYIRLAQRYIHPGLITTAQQTSVLIIYESMWRWCTPRRLVVQHRCSPHYNTRLTAQSLYCLLPWATSATD